MDERTIGRFWSNVSGLGDTECWTWGNGKGRYGRFTIAGRSFGAHRVAWEIVNGSIPDGMLVLHRCDNPPCVNPAHLWLGTQKDNIRDCMAKGRRGSCAPGGEARPNAKLTWASVAEIREGAEAGRTLAGMARQFGVSWHTVYKIVRGEKWKVAA